MTRLLSSVKTEEGTKISTDDKNFIKWDKIKKTKKLFKV